MRKWLCCLTLLLVFSGWSFADEQVLDVSVYKQGLVLNGTTLNSSAVNHPFLIFKEIVYMPLSTEMGNLAGFATRWNEDKKTLNIVKKTPVTTALPAGVYGHPDSVQVRMTGNPVTLEGDALNMGQYPALVYQDVTYMPLSWEIINSQMGWESTYHPFVGVVIQSDAHKSIQDVMNGFNLKYFEALASFINTRNSGYSAASALDTVKMIRENAVLHNVDEKWIMALWWKESNFNSCSVSSQGALGAMQIMPSTGERLGYSREQLMDPRYNVEGGTRYLAGLVQAFNGDMFLAASAYNQGSGTVSRGGFSRGFGVDVQNKFDTISTYVQNKLGQ